MFTVVGLLAASEILGSAPPQELALEQVLKANTAAINAIRSIHVTIEVSNNLPVPGEQNPPLEAQPTYIYEWYKDRPRERVRQILLRGRGPQPFDVHASDLSNGPNGFKALYNYDPNIKPPLSESFESHAGGELDKTHIDDPISGQARAMSFMSNFPGATGTLEEYVAKYPSSKLAATPATSKFGCYEITTLQEKPQIVGSSYDVKDVRVFVDPKVGFWVRRIEKGPWQRSTNPGDKGLHVTEVEEFKDCGDGIFWPLRGYIRTHLPGHTIGLDVFIRHTLHSINQPLPEDDFEIHFPDWLRVRDNVSGQYFIWGPDDKPRMTFASHAAYIEWYTPRMEDPEGTGLPRRIRWLWLTGITILVGLVLIFLIIRRRKTARQVGGISQSAEKT